MAQILKLVILNWLLLFALDALSQNNIPLETIANETPSYTISIPKGAKEIKGGSGRVWNYRMDKTDALSDLAVKVIPMPDAMNTLDQLKSNATLLNFGQVPNVVESIEADNNLLIKVAKGGTISIVEYYVAPKGSKLICQVFVLAKYNDFGRMIALSLEAPSLNETKVTTEQKTDDAFNPVWVADNNVIDSLNCYAFKNFGVLFKLPAIEVDYDKYFISIETKNYHEKGNPYWLLDLDARTFNFKGVEFVMLNIFLNGDSISSIPAGKAGNYTGPLSKRNLYYIDDKELLNAASITFYLYARNFIRYNSEGPVYSDPIILAKSEPLPIKRSLIKYSRSALGVVASAATGMGGKTKVSYLGKKLNDLNASCNLKSINALSITMSKLPIQGNLSKVIFNK